MGDAIKMHLDIQNSMVKTLKESKVEMKSFNDVIYATIYGVIITAIIQGIIGTIGLLIFGVQNPILWGMVMIILAMLPFVGAGLVWFPAAIIKIAGGDLFNGFGLLFYGLFIVSTIDNMIRPKLIGARANIHPVVILLGVLGGLAVFGLMGLIIGPLCLSILMVFIDFYVSEKNETKS